jgi:hypothetical protein
MLRPILTDRVSVFDEGRVNGPIERPGQRTNGSPETRGACVIEGKMRVYAGR